MILWLLGNYNPSAYVRGYGYKNFTTNNKIKYINFDNLKFKFDFIIRLKNLLQFIYIMFWIVFLKNSYIIIERDLPMRLLQIFERIIPYFSLHFRIVYDFDDAMWLDEFIGPRKFSRILNLAGKVICDNKLQLKFLQDNGIDKQILVLPGLLPNLNNPFTMSSSSSKQRTNICYIGTPSTLSFLTQYSAGLQLFLEKYPHVKLVLLGKFQKSALPLSLLDKIEIRDIDFPLSIQNVDDIYLGFAPLINDDKNSYYRGLHKYRVYSSLGLPSLCSNYGEAQFNLIDEVDCYMFDEHDNLFDKLEEIYNDEYTWHQIKKRCLRRFNPEAFNHQNYTELQNFLFGKSVC